MKTLMPHRRLLLSSLAVLCIFQALNAYARKNFDVLFDVSSLLPHSLIRDHAGNFIIHGNHLNSDYRIFTKYSSDGHKIGSFGMVGEVGPTPALATDSRNNIYVLSGKFLPHTPNVPSISEYVVALQKFSAQGVLLKEINLPCENRGVQGPYTDLGITYPGYSYATQGDGVGLAVDSSDVVRVLHVNCPNEDGSLRGFKPVVRSYDSELTPRSKLFIDGNASYFNGYYNGIALATSPDGRTLFVATDAGIVLKLDATTGAQLMKFGSGVRVLPDMVLLGDQDIPSIITVVVTPSGHLLVGGYHPHHHYLKEFASDGSFIRQFGRGLLSKPFRDISGFASNDSSGIYFTGSRNGDDATFVLRMDD